MVDIINGVNIGDAEDGFAFFNQVIGLDTGHAVVTGSTGFPGDTGDVYAIQPAVSGTIAISLEGLGQDLDIYLYDENREEVDSSWRLGNANEIIYFDVVAGSPYYVEVYPVTGGSNYTLILDLPVSVPLPSELGKKDVVNGSDIGDAGYYRFNAIEIGLNNIGDGIVSGSTGHYTDSTDWYFFTPAESGEVSIKLTGMDSNLDFALYDQGNNIIDYSVNPGNSDDVILFDAIGGQSYIIEIDNFEQGSNYVLLIDAEVSFSPSFGVDRVNGGLGEDAGATRDTALHVGWNRDGIAYLSGSTGFGGDMRDWFTFQASEFGKASLTFTGDAAGTELSIFDESGNLINPLLVSSSYTETYSFFVAPDDTYYFRVSSQSGPQSYAVQLALPKPRPEAFPISVEPKLGGLGNSSEYGNSGAFALLKTDGSVVTWGDYNYGGSSYDVAEAISSDVVQVFTNSKGFAALKSDGSVVVWGQYELVESSNGIAHELQRDVVAIFSGPNHFVALKADGSVVTWGGFSEELGIRPEELNSGVIQIIASEHTFTALKSDGTAVSWRGMNYEAVSVFDAGDVTAILPAGGAFAALRSDGSVITWGTPHTGGDSSAVADKLTEGVVKIYTNGTAYAALKDDGSVVRWGEIAPPFIVKDIDSQLTSGVVEIFYNANAFAALKEDGSVVTWGSFSYGGGFYGEDLTEALSSGVVSIQAFSGGFVAFKDDGSIVPWGNYLEQKAPYVEELLSGNVVTVIENSIGIAVLNADGSVVASILSEDTSEAGLLAGKLSSGVKSIHAIRDSFAALKADGSVVTWGYSFSAPDASTAIDLSSGVVEIFTNGEAFSALKGDGAFVTWGFAISDNDQILASLQTDYVEIATPHSNNYHLNGTEGADDVSGFPGNNFIATFGGNDSIWGGPIDDVIDGGAGNDTLFLYGQPDEYVLSGNLLSSVEGDDTISGIEFVGFGFAFNSNEHEIVIDLAALMDMDSSEAVKTFAGEIYRIALGTYRDAHGLLPEQGEAMLSFKEFYSLSDDFEYADAGTEFGDELQGKSTPDLLYGDNGNDVITGASGEDLLIGGSGRDVFRFVSAAESTSTAYDTIIDYSSGDSLRFEGMAGITLHDDDFSWRGSLSSTVSAIKNQASSQNQAVFFSDGTDGYLYIKGSGSGISYDDTLVKLEDCTVAPVVADALGIPVTGEKTIDLIEMYVTIAGRAPDAGGLAFWSEVMEGGKTIDYIAGEMWETADAKTIYPRSMTTEEVVTAVYGNVLNRSPDDEGLNYWVERWDDNGPVDTMLEMIHAINTYSGNLPEGIAARELFLEKVDIGGFLSITQASDDLALARSAFAFLEDGNSLEATLVFIEDQISPVGTESLGQSSLSDNQLAVG